MKVQQVQQLKQNQNNEQLQKKQPQFKAADAFLRCLATNQAIGATAVDFGFMVVPRTGTDLVKRGPAAGLETGRREASGTLNHALIGVYGGAAGAAIAVLSGIGREYDVKANKIMAAKETVDILAENKAAQLKENKHQIDYITETLKNMKAYNPSSTLAEADGYINLSHPDLKNTIDDVAKTLDNVILDKKLDFGKWKNSKSEDSLTVVINKLIKATGTESEYILKSADGTVQSKSTLKTFLEDFYKISEAFNKPKVKEAFEKQIADGKEIAENAFVKAQKKFSKNKALAGFAIGSAVGMSIQPLNVYLTKKKTGTDGFVGVEGREKDRSTNFKLLKAGSAAAFWGMVLLTLKNAPGKFMDKMAFKGFFPTIEQLKGVYGLTIISRILATRDKDELRESLTKDTLGFLSWLVLGDIVNKVTATALDDPEHTVLNTTERNVKGIWKNIKRAFNAKLKTRDEVVLESLAGTNIPLTKLKDGKQVPKTFKDLLKDLETLSPEARKIAKKRLGTLNKAQWAGYLFSGLVLGLGIPNLNIFITNKLDKKRKEKAAAQAAEQAELQRNMEAMNAAVAYMHS